MNYKQEIFRLLEQIEDNWILQQIYRCVVNITK